MQLISNTPSDDQALYQHLMRVADERILLAWVREFCLRRLIGFSKEEAKEFLTRRVEHFILREFQHHVPHRSPHSLDDLYEHARHQLWSRLWDIGSSPSFAVGMHGTN